MGVYCSLVCETDGAKVDIERRWDMLDYLLTGGRKASHDEPSAFLSFTGWEELASEAHRIPAANVALIAGWLDKIDDAELLGNFEPAAFAKTKVYDAELALEEPGPYKLRLAQDITGIRKLFATAHQNGDNVIRIIG